VPWVYLLWVTQNSGYAPFLLKSGNGAGHRASFTALGAGLYLISATYVGGAGTYSFRAAETTLVSPRWSTTGGNDVLWGLLNVSDIPITGTLTFFDSNGSAVDAEQVRNPSIRLERGLREVRRRRNYPLGQAREQWRHSSPVR